MKGGKTIRESILPLFFPQYDACHLCGAAIAPEMDTLLCEGCLKELYGGRLSRHEAMLGGFPPLAMTVSAFWHEDPARQLVFLLKYEGEPLAAQPLAMGMAGALTEVRHKLPPLDLMIPVPLHPKRERERGYNQALLLAKGVEAHTGIPVREDCLARVQFTGTQTRRGSQERYEAMKGVFQVPEGADLQGKNILLVDDVLTTGATAVHCAGVLLESGAASVTLLTANRA